LATPNYGYEKRQKELAKKKKKEDKLKSKSERKAGDPPEFESQGGGDIDPSNPSQTVPDAPAQA
jgi:hypothetical protein